MKGTRRKQLLWRGVMMVGSLAMFTLFIVPMIGVEKRAATSVDESLRARRSVPLQTYPQMLQSPSLCSNRTQTAQQQGNDQFPPDLFTATQRRHGAILLHLFALGYMFIALAIVCDEFFVPALTIITETLDINDDVAAATFMAAGGSAPEFFTSVIGVFIAHSNVGIGTIVGSALFNILCVLSFCTFFSRTVLQLSWWPLFRDITFYSFSLFILLLFFLDELIYWYEAACMFGMYIVYAGFMRYNEVFEKFVKVNLLGNDISVLDEEQCESIIDQTISTTRASPSTHAELSGTVSAPHGTRHFVSKPSLHRADSLAAGRRRASAISTRRQSIPILHSGAMFRNGIMQQIMSQTLDSVDEQGDDDGRRKSSTTCSIKHVARNPNAVIVARQNGTPGDSRSSQRRSTKAEIEQLRSIIEEDEEKPLDMSWPEELKKQLIYVFLSPILFPLWVTLPDVRRPESKKWFVVSFVGSILWIAAFSYVMVWMANTIGETFFVPTEVMGLTVLAAGTSVPDLITSVIVARKGLGDMAVSSSIGSNLFDICVGLAVPWLLYFLYSFITNGTVEPVSVSSNGLLCSVSALVFMLVVLVTVIGISKWRMNKLFGCCMIVFYIVFCALSIGLEMRFFQCPLRLC
ncbi:Sodium/potassium/calcium exchanger 1 [Aphelenchoides besseyi]|nr:Sodium/potassium/calcium exchanger 1 [Aphelenchoides besseyi]